MDTTAREHLSPVPLCVIPPLLMNAFPSSCSSTPALPANTMI